MPTPAGFGKSLTATSRRIHPYPPTKKTRLPFDRRSDAIHSLRPLNNTSLGHRVTTLAYPFGDTDERVRRAAAAAGYKRAYVTTNHGWRSEIPFLRRFDWPRRDLAWEVFRMRERDRKRAQRQA